MESATDFFSTKDEHKVEHKTIFKTHACTCEISYGRGIRTQKPKRLSPTPYHRTVSYLVEPCRTLKFSFEIFKTIKFVS